MAGRRCARWPTFARSPASLRRTAGPLDGGDRGGDRLIGGAGVGGAEDRRPGDKQVGAGGGHSGAVVGSIPPSTSSATAEGRIARSRGIFSSECLMNGCPPQPGLTVMQSARSIEWAISLSAPTAVAGLIATPTEAPSSRTSPAT